MTFQDIRLHHPHRHPDRPEEPALSLSKGAEGSRLDLTNEDRTQATGFFHSAARRAAPVGMTGGGEAIIERRIMTNPYIS